MSNEIDSAEYETMESMFVRTPDSYALNRWDVSAINPAAKVARRFFSCYPDVLVGVDSIPVDFPRKDLHKWEIPIVIWHLRTIVVDHLDHWIVRDLLLEKHFHVIYVSFNARPEEWLAAYRGFAYTVNWRKIDEDGPGLHAPKRYGDVGHDLEALHDVEIPPDSLARVPCNIEIELPPTMYGWITARSSLAAQRLMVPNGIIDAGYRGPIFVQVLNLSQSPRILRQGDRVGQMIFQPILPVQIDEVDVFTYPTERGDGGFGSTGA